MDSSTFSPACFFSRISSGIVFMNSFTLQACLKSLMWIYRFLKESSIQSQTKQQVESFSLYFPCDLSSCFLFQSFTYNLSKSAFSADPSGQIVMSYEKGRIFSRFSPSSLIAKQCPLVHPKVLYSLLMQLLIRRVQKWLSRSLNYSYYTFSASQEKSSLKIQLLTGPTLIILAILRPQLSSPQARQESLSSAFLSMALTYLSFLCFQTLYYLARSSRVVSPKLRFEKKQDDNLASLIQFMNGLSVQLSSMSMGSGQSMRLWAITSSQASLSSGFLSNSSFMQISCHLSSSTTYGLSRQMKSVTFSQKQSISIFFELSESRYRQSFIILLISFAFSIYSLFMLCLIAILCLFLDNCTLSYLVFLRLTLTLMNGQNIRCTIVQMQLIFTGSNVVYLATIRELCLAILFVTMNLAASPSLRFTTRLREQLSTITVCSLQKVTGLPPCIWSVSPKDFRSEFMVRKFLLLVSLPLSSNSVFLLFQIYWQKRNLWSSASLLK